MVENRQFFIPLTFDAPVRGVPVGISYRHPVWYGKTRMVWLPDGEKISKISLFVLAQLTNVTDAQTDRRTPGDGIYRAYAYASRGKTVKTAQKMTIGVPVVTCLPYIYRCPLRIVCAERTIYLR